MIVTKRESMSSLIHDTSPTLRHSVQQSHNKGLYYGFRDAILSRTQSQVGGHDTRELYTRGGSSRVNRDGRAIHRKQGGGGSYSQLCLTIGTW